MFVVEYRTIDGRISHWEISKAVPRDSAGKPVESGILLTTSADDAEVIGDPQELEIAIQLLRQRNMGEIRVTEVERAWGAAKDRGPMNDRRVKGPAWGAPRETAGARTAQPISQDRRVAKKPLTLPLGKFVTLAVAAVVLYFVARKLGWL